MTAEPKKPKVPPDVAACAVHQHEWEKGHAKTVANCPRRIARLERKAAVAAAIEEDNAEDA